MRDNQHGTQQAGDIEAGSSDPIDEAIAATDPQHAMVGTTVVIASTGRPANVAIPVGITVPEMAELVNWMWTQLFPASQQAANPQSRPVAVLDTPRGPIAVKRN